MMHKWRNSHLIVLALVALLASALPSLAWVCSSAHCVEEETTAQITVEKCKDAECLRGAAECCQPLQLPGDNDAPNVPSQKQTSADGLLFSAAKFAISGNFLAIVPVTPQINEPILKEKFRLVDVASCVLTQAQSPPLPGRSPPTL